MSKSVSVGIIGTSWYADGMHLPALKSHPQVNLVAICGRNQERASELAQKYEIPQVFSDYQSMINSAGIEAVVIAAPDDMHYPMTMAALDAGLHVLCEKPLTLKATQAEEMYRRADAAGVKHMTYFTWRWMPSMLYLQQLLKEGYVGKPYYSEFHFVGNYGRDGGYGWKWDPQRGLGILGDLGVHMIDLACWSLGDIEKVSAHLSMFVPHSGADGKTLAPTNDSVLLSVQYQNGSHGTIHVSAVAHTGNVIMPMQIVIYGEEGTLEMDFNFTTGYEIRGAKSNEEAIKPLTIPEEILNGLDPATPIMAQFNQIYTGQSVGTRLFIDAIANGAPLSPTFYDGWQAQRVIDAAVESNQTGRWVSL